MKIPNELIVPAVVYLPLLLLSLTGLGIAVN